MKKILTLFALLLFVSPSASWSMEDEEFSDKNLVTTSPRILCKLEKTEVLRPAEDELPQVSSWLQYKEAFAGVATLAKEDLKSSIRGLIKVPGIFFQSAYENPTLTILATACWIVPTAAAAVNGRCMCLKNSGNGDKWLLGYNTNQTNINQNTLEACYRFCAKQPYPNYSWGAYLAIGPSYKPCS